MKSCKQNNSLDLISSNASIADKSNTKASTAALSLEINGIVEKLKNKKLSIREIPEEFALHINIVQTERKLGIRKSKQRGFDVISQKFFVEEEWISEEFTSPYIEKITFDSFTEFYTFLAGDIYEQACYYQYAFDDDYSKALDLNIDQLKKNKHFISETVDDYTFEPSQDEINRYSFFEKNIKTLCKQWLANFYACDTYEGFKKVCTKYNKSELSKYKQIEFFFFQYAFYSQCDSKRINTIMEYLSNDYWLGGNAVLGLCLVFNPDDVIEKYNFLQGSRATKNKREKALKDFYNNLKNGDVEIDRIGYFDKTTHFFCEEIKVYQYMNDRGRKVLNKWQCIHVCHAFESFDEFIKHRNGDLRNCNLFKALDLENVDFSCYKIDSTTVLPLNKYYDLNYVVKKSYTNGKFLVEQCWQNNHQVIKSISHEFEYFFDFIAFLKGDLSEANLIFCTGLKYLTDFKNINLQNALLTSDLCKQFNIKYEPFEYNKKLVSEFPMVEKNEKQTAVVLQTLREIPTNDKDIDIFNENNISRIYYITDIHLMHKIKNAGCQSRQDIVFLIQRIVDSILFEGSDFSLTLIGGDISSDFSVFELFVETLSQSANEYIERHFAFILGNHEFWSFPGLSVEQIVAKYRQLLKKHGMYLIHNELFYKNEFDEMGILSYDDLMHQNSEIVEKLRYTRLVVLGGVGFSGYNNEFNANNGIYNTTIDRATEIQESNKFEFLYNKLTNLLNNKNTIIFTHMPKSDWSQSPKYHENYVYVSGHTHRNAFFDDGVERLYADNQIGYRNQEVHLKSFLINNEYDCFSEYENGIYEITAQAYQDFARGKNISMSFNREVNTLFMLKKEGYYCFIHKAKDGSLSILNGGALKRLEQKDVFYYFNHMGEMISYIQKPLEKYTEYQKSIAYELKRIGASGKIHGCIIDVDFYNHIYVNPIDLSITAYWAYDMIDKVVYPSIPTLLQAQCPAIFSNYIKLVENKKEKRDCFFAQKSNTEMTLLPEIYLATNIYTASREIKKMQKLNSNVLTIWYDDGLGVKPLLSKLADE